MEVLIINQREVPQLLPMGECICVMEKTLAALAQGQAVLPLRSAIRLPGGELLALMPSYLAGIPTIGVKAITVFSANHGTEYDSHQGAVLVFEAQHGSLCAVVDATAITAIRTGAVSGLATRLLARPDAGDLALLGAGTQASGHLDAMLQVRQIRRVRVWSASLHESQRFADAESARHGIKVEPVPAAEEAVRGADLICTVTSASTPILQGDWLSPGAHINAVGSSIPATRELDTNAVVRSRLFVDRRESTTSEAGDFLFPKREGAIGDDHILAEVGEVLLGLREGRRSPEEITLFKSLGLAVEDLAAAHYVYEQARERGLGTSVELGGRHHAAL